MRSEEQSGGASAVALPPAPELESAAASAPHIAQVNVSRNSRMHIGPQFVSVTQNVHRDRVVKGRVLGLWLETRAVASGGARRLRCSVAVCVCWALALAAALAVYVGWLAFAARPHRLDLDINATWYLRRGDWQAMPEYSASFLSEPARFALVGHTATPACDDRYQCTKGVLDVQSDHLRRGWVDIGPNYLVGGGDEGLVLEGRGAGVLGQMVPSWNSRSVSLMWMGDYRHDAPTAAQLRHVRTLLEALVAAGVLHPQYTLLGHCQVVPWIFSPGVRLLEHLKAFDHWASRDLVSCLQWCTRDSARPGCKPAETSDVVFAAIPADDDSSATSIDDNVTTPADDASSSLEHGPGSTFAEPIVSQ